MAESYPIGRPSFFCNRCLRAAFKCCLAQHIGADCVALLAVIAHTEDAKRYSGPVTYYNQQLLPILGFSRWERLDKSRKLLVEAGWLHYECQGKRKPGIYWSVIPEEFVQLEDSPMDEGLCTFPGYKQGYSDGYKQGYKSGAEAGIEAAQSGGQRRRSDGDNEGYPSNLVPSPTSSPAPSPAPSPVGMVATGVATVRATAVADASGAGGDIANGLAGKAKKKNAAYSDRFEEFWKAFPSGRKKSKDRGWKAWPDAVRNVHAYPPNDKLPEEEAWQYLIRRAGEYSVSNEGSGQHVKMPSSWLNSRCWLDDPAAWENDGNRQGHGDPRGTMALLERRRRERAENQSS